MSERARDGASRKESPYLTWVKGLPPVEINLASSAVPACPASALGPAEPDAPLNDRSDYGWPPLLHRLAARYGVHESAVAVAAGASMANHLAIATLIERGDHVLVECPGYDPLVHLPALWGATVDALVRLPRDGYRVDPDAVRRALTPRTRLVVLSHLHNPTGVALQPSDLAALVALADEHGLHILVDEVYGEWLIERGALSAARASPRVVATSSLTKVWGLGGLRVGWVLAEPGLADRMRRFAGLFDNVLAHPSERLAVRALDRSAAIIGSHLALVARNLARLRAWVASTPGASWVEPAAGTVAFVDLGRGDTSAFVERLARGSRTLVVPGRFFGAPEGVRIGLGIDPALLDRGLARMSEALTG